MAQTIIGVNDPQTNQAWSKKCFVEALKETLMDRFVGSGDNNAICVRDELKAGGDRITIPLRMQLTGKGVMGDAVAENQAEALSFYTDKLYIDQLRHVVNVTGLASQQRVAYSKRAEANSGLRDWWSNRLDVSFLNQACGNTAQTDLEYTGLNTPLAPSSTRAFYGGSATQESDLTDSSGKFTLQLIDKCVLRARTASPAIRPIRIGGKDYYIMVLHPNQAYDLRTNMSEGQWVKLQLAAMQGGKINDNPLITGALGQYGPVLLFEDARVPWGDNTQANASYHTDLGAAANGTTDVARGVFMGAQALGMAFGRDGGWPEKLRWVEVLKDGENQLNIFAGMILGVKKMVFNSVDYGTITVSTYSPGA